jgi:hypothetical protein
VSIFFAPPKRPALDSLEEVRRRARDLWPVLRAPRRRAPAARRLRDAAAALRAPAARDQADGTARRSASSRLWPIASPI